MPADGPLLGRRTALGVRGELLEQLQRADGPQVRPDLLGEPLGAVEYAAADHDLQAGARVDRADRVDHLADDRRVARGRGEHEQDVGAAGADLGEDLVAGDAAAAEPDRVPVGFGEVRHELAGELIRLGGPGEHEDRPVTRRLLRVPRLGLVDATPVAAYNLVARDAGGGAVITASHNPAQWNGFKFKPDYGGSASPEIVAELEALIASAEASGDVPRISLAEAQAKGLLEYVDPRPSYLSHMATLVDLQAIRDAGLKVVVDSMHGAGGGYFAALISGSKTQVSELRAEPNPAFPGMAQPEPIAHNLDLLMAAVPAQSADVGLATDGDADRPNNISVEHNGIKTSGEK